jgi:hypothetical protein
MRPAALKCGSGSLSASFRKSNHESFAVPDECTVILGTLCLYTIGKLAFGLQLVL